MPIAWDKMSFRQMINSTLDCVDGLTEEDRIVIQGKWADQRPIGGAYPDTLSGRIEALADLQRLAVRHLLEKLGRLDELEPRQTK